MRTLAVLLICLVPLAAAAQVPLPEGVQNQDRTFTPGADLDTIRERGWIEFAVYEDFRPYSWLEDGEPRGTDIELGRIIAEALGVEARFRLVIASETVDDDLRNYVWKGPLVGERGDVVNVMLHVPWDRELDVRNEQVVLGGKYMVETVDIAFRRADYPDGGPVPAYFRFDTVGVENDSIADFYLSGVANGQLRDNMRRFPSVDAAMAALRAGEVKAVMGPLSQLQAGLDETLDIHQPPLPGLSRGTWTLGVAFRHNYRTLGYAINDAIGAAIADGRLEAAFARYGIVFRAPER